MSDLVPTSGAGGALALDSSSTLHVVFKLNGAEYAVSSEVVLQMESFTGATPLPGAPAFVAGLIQLRGRVVPVVDLRARFGLPAAAATLDTRVVVGKVKDRVVALLVDSAREVVRIPAGSVKPPPAIVADGAQGYVSAVAQLGGRLLLIVDFSRVIGEETLDVQ